MNEEESKISKVIPLRQATHEELTEVITDLHTQNYLKEMEIVRLNNIIKEAKDFIANNSTISGTFGKNGKMIVESIEEIHNGMRLFEILDKAGSDKE